MSKKKKIYKSIVKFIYDKKLCQEKMLDIFFENMDLEFCKFYCSNNIKCDKKIFEDNCQNFLNQVYGDIK